MELFEAIRRRHSVRSFAATPVTREQLEQIADAGRLAPTAHNDQPWQFVLVTDADTRKKIADLTDYGKFIADSPACIAVFCEPTKYYLEDGCAAVQNMLLAITAMGLAACWVAGDKKPYAPKVGELLGVPKELKLVALIAVGYPRGEVPRPQKKPLQQVVHWQRYGQK